jgi:hypothetical protein
MLIDLYLQGKLGPSKSSVVLTLKSWWRPSFTFSVTGIQVYASFIFGTDEEVIEEVIYIQTHE